MEFKIGDKVKIIGPKDDKAVGEIVTVCQVYPADVEGCVGPLVAVSRNNGSVDNFRPEFLEPFVEGPINLLSEFLASRETYFPEKAESAKPEDLSQTQARWARSSPLISAQPDPIGVFTDGVIRLQVQGLSSFREVLIAAALHAALARGQSPQAAATDAVKAADRTVSLLESAESVAEQDVTPILNLISNSRSLSEAEFANLLGRKPDHPVTQTLYRALLDAGIALARFVRADLVLLCQPPK